MFRPRAIRILSNWAPESGMRVFDLKRNAIESSMCVFNLKRNATESNRSPEAHLVVYNEAHSMQCIIPSYSNARL